MRKFLILFLCWSVASANVFAMETVVFNDITPSPYEQSILNLYEAEIVEGYDDGGYHPYEPINRAELTKMVVASLYPDSETYEGNCFSDVNDQWYSSYVCRAKDLGIVEGYDGGAFEPGGKANMVEAFKIVLESFEIPIAEVEEGEEWFEPYREFVHVNGILSKFAHSADKKINRGEVAKLVDDIRMIKSGEKAMNTDEVVKSDGCGKIKPASPIQTFRVGGESRTAITAVPAGYNSNDPVSLIFAFHGRTSPNNVVRQYFKLEKPIGNKGIVVYPQAKKGSYGHSWSGDSAFFDEMLSELSDKYCIDADRVFVLGHSLGSSFANDLACVRGNSIRAVASLGGAASNLTQCSGRVASIQLHNPNDRLASFAAAVNTRNWYIERNECSEETEVVEPFWGECRLYKGC